jgi:hypothetical protein
MNPSNLSSEPGRDAAYERKQNEQCSEAESAGKKLQRHFSSKPNNGNLLIAGKGARFDGDGGRVAWSGEGGAELIEGAAFFQLLLWDDADFDACVWLAWHRRGALLLRCSARAAAAGGDQQRKQTQTERAVIHVSALAFRQIFLLGHLRRR